MYCSQSRHQAATSGELFWLRIAQNPATPSICHTSTTLVGTPSTSTGGVTQGRGDEERVEKSQWRDPGGTRAPDSYRDAGQE